MAAGTWVAWLLGASGTYKGVTGTRTDRDFAISTAGKFAVESMLITLPGGFLELGTVHEKTLGRYQASWFARVYKNSVFTNLLVVTVDKIQSIKWTIEQRSDGRRWDFKANGAVGYTYDWGTVANGVQPIWGLYVYESTICVPAGAFTGMQARNAAGSWVGVENLTRQTNVTGSPIYGTYNSSTKVWTTGNGGPLANCPKTSPTGGIAYDVDSTSIKKLQTDHYIPR